MIYNSLQYSNLLCNYLQIIILVDTENINLKFEILFTIFFCQSDCLENDIIDIVLSLFVYIREWKTDKRHLNYQLV